MARREESLRSAVSEIHRLQSVIDEQTRPWASAVVSNVDVSVDIVPDVAGLRTLVSTKPRQYEFYLADKLATCSDDHKRAFHRQVVRGFSEREAEKIGLAIWGAK